MDGPLHEMRGIFCSYLFWDTANGIWTDNIQSLPVNELETEREKEKV